MSPTRILLLTNSEHGQANVFLATSHALLTLPRPHNDDDDDIPEVHFASFPPISKFVAQTSHHALSSSPSSHPIVFHPISGLPMLQAWSRPEFEAERDGSRHAQGIRTAWRKMQVLLRVTLPWTGPEFMEIFHSVAEIIRRVNPHITAVDPAFAPALTAVRHLGVHYLILSPNTIKDFAMPFQPNLEALWRYPCVGSAFAFPIPVRWVPLNLLLVLLALLAGAWDGHRRRLGEFVRVHGGGARLTSLNELSLGPPDGGVKVLVANRLALEFPLKVLPRHVVPCGPIIRPARGVGEVDGEMAGWLRGGPTVYVNLGTHVMMSEESAVEMATALRILLDHARGARWRGRGMEGLRVLWKLAVEGEGEGEGERGESRVYRILGRDVESGAVRIVRWIEAEPTAVLEEENVVCAVHHGGANSFLETASAGIPQVVLPVWMDTFDFARRAELLGIGRWGNKMSQKTGAPWGGELGNVLIEVLLGPESTRIKERARELAQLCRQNGGGRVIAAKMILRESKEDDMLSQSSGPD
ncbi:UDP-Glycosyltransferase/glycogen phosphorylase [Coniochaeta ligniaria NRRL 30616]|uniref:UDP-Glycosyltransferase/glycogen phosphorylase n=1 Tax=Coniochaeta ligniaria NRRL 30616 TaxID=1408157 RepID=A0A1J7JGX4_9PEZI|nr:UDP-Glycosyltransferase/glycogen phosphorylase [Coniochaeta ligniaria NRRL 30616]